MTISLVLLLAAFILFVLAACGVGARFNLQAAGLAFWVLSVLLNGTHILRAVAIVGLVLILSGCANDQAFRNSVESLSVGAETTNSGASGNFTVHLREPRGFSK